VAFSATTSTALRYWNIARQRYCCRLAQNPSTRRVSADPLAQPAAHSRAEGRGFRPTKASASERRTLCWREVDSNPRSLSRKGRPLWPKGDVKRGSLMERSLSRGGPEGLNPLPPPASLPHWTDSTIHRLVRTMTGAVPQGNGFSSLRIVRQAGTGRRPAPTGERGTASPSRRHR
jgi:hypothetical protein